MTQSEMINTTTNYHAVCDNGYTQVRCLAYVRDDVDGGRFSPTRDYAQAPGAMPSGYGPSQLLSAYALSTSGGAGQTVALVEEGDYKTAEHDLGVYRSKFGLSACTTANGCFKKVGQSGGAVPPPDPNWAQETALDEDMVSAICPNCHILIVEANAANLADLGAATDTGAKLGATEISNSYGGGESGASNSNYNHPGIIITASSGDSGPGVSQPCTYSTVVCTGGTTLSKGGHGSRGWTEGIWSGSGGGCSAVVAKPSWQRSYTKCSRRVAPDVAFDANPNTGVAVYDSTPAGGVSGWLVFGGTSVASPAIASVYALAGNSSSLNAAQQIWTNTSHTGLFVITGKYNTYTGWGTPDGTSAF